MWLLPYFVVYKIYIQLNLFSHFNQCLSYRYMHHSLKHSISIQKNIVMLSESNWSISIFADLKFILNIIDIDFLKKKSRFKL